MVHSSPSSRLDRPPLAPRTRLGAGGAGRARSTAALAAAARSRHAASERCGAAAAAGAVTTLPGLLDSLSGSPPPPRCGLGGSFRRTPPRPPRCARATCCARWRSGCAGRRRLVGGDAAAEAHLVRTRRLWYLCAGRPLAAPAAHAWAAPSRWRRHLAPPRGARRLGRGVGVARRSAPAARPVLRLGDGAPPPRSAGCAPPASISTRRRWRARRPTSRRARRRAATRSRRRWRSATRRRRRRCPATPTSSSPRCRGAQHAAPRRALGDLLEALPPRCRRRPLSSSRRRRSPKSWSARGRRRARRARQRQRGNGGVLTARVGAERRPAATLPPPRAT